jgi:hypothetical protein
MFMGTDHTGPAWHGQAAREAGVGAEIVIAERQRYTGSNDHVTEAVMARKSIIDRHQFRRVGARAKHRYPPQNEAVSVGEAADPSSHWRPTTANHSKASHRRSASPRRPG